MGRAFNRAWDGYSSQFKAWFCSQPRHEQTKFVHKSMVRDGSWEIILRKLSFYICWCRAASFSYVAVTTNFLEEKTNFVAWSPSAGCHMQNHVMQTFEAMEEAKIGAKKKNLWRTEAVLEEVAVKQLGGPLPFQQALRRGAVQVVQRGALHVHKCKEACMMERKIQRFVSVQVCLCFCFSVSRPLMRNQLHACMVDCGIPCRRAGAL